MQALVVAIMASLVFAGCVDSPSAPPSQLPSAAEDAGLLAWRLLGVLPFGSADVSGLRLPDGRFLIYYIEPASTSNATSRPGRAFSEDGIAWTPDPSWTCDDLCERVPEGLSLGQRREIRLADGTYRSYVSGYAQPEEGFVGGPGIVSYHSRDGLDWSREPGARLVPNRSLEWEGGFGTGSGLSAILLPDGRTRLYYLGAKAATGEQVLLSATSSDGLDFTREPGHRLHAATLGLVPPPRDGFITQPHVLEVGGRIRAYFAASFVGGQIASSEDGLEFELDGTFPGEGADSFVIVKEGRTIILTSESVAPGSPCGGSGCANHGGATRAFVYEETPFAVGEEARDQSIGEVRLQVSGARDKPVALRVIDEGIRGGCKSGDNSSECRFDAAAFSFTPGSGTPPFTSVFRYDPSRPPWWLLVGASDGATTTVVKLHCFDQPPEALACHK